MNFDAEVELADPSARTPSRVMIERRRALALRVTGLIPDGDVVVDAALDPPLEARGARGRAWCPTPGAIAALTRAGASIEAAPSLAILRRVNHRAFSASLGDTLPGARFATSIDEVARAIEAPSPTSKHLIKQALGFAGRGRIVVSGALDDAAARAIQKAIDRDGGVQVEPLVERTDDLAIHGFVDARGHATIGEPTRQRCDDRGAWIASERAARSDLANDEATALAIEARRVARALTEAGYFGPFGVDAFRYRHADGTIALRSRSEINARYSMGWAIGMGDERPDLTA